MVHMLGFDQQGTSVNTAYSDYFVNAAYLLAVLSIDACQSGC